MQNSKRVKSREGEIPQTKTTLANMRPLRKTRLSFENVRYQVTVPKRPDPEDHPVMIILKRMFDGEVKEILHGITGVVNPGDFVALMGRSGAGKSTLLNILSKRLEPTSGDVIYESNTGKASWSFIEQEDIFFGFKIVEGTVIDLPGPKEKKKKKKKKKVAQSQIGNSQMGTKRGISGGEKKRLSVATGLLSNPAVLFADEPTGGLSEYGANYVVSTLQMLASQGHTIISTIHQPSTEVFEKFDKVLLMAEGRIVYFGDRVGAIVYFCRLGHELPPHTNPADFLIDILDGEKRSEKVFGFVTLAEKWKFFGELFLQEWENSLKTKFEALVHSGGSPASLPAVEDKPVEVFDNEQEEDVLTYHKAIKEVHAASRTTQFSILFKRELISNVRNKVFFHARVIQTLITALLGGAIYFQVSPTAIASLVGASFFLVLTQAVVGGLGVVQAFTTEAPIALREYHSHLYNIGAYYWAKILADSVFQVLNPILFTSIIWFMIGINPSQFGFVLVIIFLCTNAMISIGYFVSGASKSLHVALAIMPMVIMPLAILSGCLVNRDTLSEFWTVVSYISPYRFGFSGVMHAMLKDVNIRTCGPTAPNPCFETGDDLLKFYALENDTFGMNCTGLVVHIVVYRLLGAFCLSVRTKTQKSI